MTIRPVRPNDIEDLYRICLLTGDAGEDASPLYADPRLPGEIFAAPYAVLEPSLAFVAEDAQGVSGYVLGALDTREFEQRLEREWWPALRRRYPDPGEQPGTTAEQMMAYIHRPPVAPAELLADYPSHLHIDLLPRTQGQGVGRRLITELAAALRQKGSHGVHLHVGAKNTRAIGFYEHIGFTELDRTGSGRTMGMSFR